MFIVKFFGIMDLFAALILILEAMGICPLRPALGFALYLFLKGMMFKGDLASVIDMIISILIVILFFVGAVGSFSILTLIAVLYLLQKAFFSWVTI
jgi:hypothetical protein